MVEVRAVADAEAALPDRANAFLAALVIEADAYGRRTLTGTSAPPLGNAHDPKASAPAGGCASDPGSLSLLAGLIVGNGLVTAACTPTGSPTGRASAFDGGGVRAGWWFRVFYSWFNGSGSARRRESLRPRAASAPIRVASALSRARSRVGLLAPI